MGPPEVELFVDNALRKGDLEVEASLVQGEQTATAEPVVPATRAQLRVHRDRRRPRDPVDRELLTIGRLADCEVVVDDTDARAHHRGGKKRQSGLSR